MYKGRVSVERLFTLFYTLTVVLSCTIIGHIYSSFLGIYFLTALVIISCTLILFNTFDKSQFKFRINILLTAYVLVYIYAVIRGNNGLVAYLPLFSLIICACLGSKYAFDVTLARKLVELIATIASILLILQALFHGLFDIHINLIPISILKGDQLNYIPYLTTGYSTGSNIYRPSSIFLESSHYVQYVFVALLSVLYPVQRKRINYNKAFLYTLGIITTISSTGLALLAIFWSLWAIGSSNQFKLPKWFRLVLIVTIVFCGGFILIQINTSLGVYLQRILPSNLLNTASEQQDRFWSARYLNTFGRTEWLLGRGLDSELSGFSTGVVRIIYRMGIVGLSVYVAVLIKVAVQTKGFYRYVCLGYIVLLFGAEFDIFRYIVFYLSFAFSGLQKHHTNQSEDEIV